MLDLFGNHIVRFVMSRLIFWVKFHRMTLTEELNLEKVYMTCLFCGVMSLSAIFPVMQKPLLPKLIKYGVFVNIISRFHKHQHHLEKK